MNMDFTLSGRNGRKVTLLFVISVRAYFFRVENVYSLTISLAGH